MTPQTFETLDFETTKRCNLHCGYCYRNRPLASAREASYAAVVADMPLGVARRAVRWFIRQARSQRVTINFMGAEPLTAVYVIEEVMVCARRVAERKGIEVAFGGSTNATLIDERVLALAKSGLRLNLSLDGTPAAHDAKRLFEDGSGSAQRAFEGASKYAAVATNVEARMTVTPETVRDLAAGVEYLRGYVAGIFVEPDYSQAWPAEALAEFSAQLRAAADSYITALASGKPFYLGPLEARIRSLVSQRRPERRCGAGTGMIAVDVDGCLYPCHRFVGDRRFAVGDVAAGADPKAIAPFREFTPRFHARPEGAGCAYCSACLICTGGCPAVNVARSGDPAAIPADWCAVQRIVAREALRALYLLSHDDEARPHFDARFKGRGARQSAAAVPAPQPAPIGGGCCL